MVELTHQQGSALLDAECRRVLGISGEEFLTGLDDGTIDPGDEAVAAVAMLEPFARTVRVKDGRHA